MFVAFACCKIGRNKDVTDCQKGVIAFGCLNWHNIEEGTQFAGISHSTVKRIFSRWKETVDIESE